MMLNNNTMINELLDVFLFLHMQLLQAAFSLKNKLINTPCNNSTKLAEVQVAGIWTPKHAGSFDHLRLTATNTNRVQAGALHANIVHPGFPQ